MATDIFLCMSKDKFRIQRNAAACAYGSQDARCPGAVEVLSFEHSITQKGSESGGRPRSVEYVEHGEFVITKAVDSRSPLLFQFCADATYIGQVAVLCFSATGASWDTYPFPYLIYDMSYVHVNSVSPSGGSGVPKEKVGFKYGQMKITWHQGGIAMPGHHEAGTTEREWSLVMQIPKGIAGGLLQGDPAEGSTWPPPDLP